MTGQAGEDGFIGRVGVAVGAIDPLSGVGAGIDGEEGAVVLDIIFNDTGGVASETDRALIAIAWHTEVDTVDGGLLVATEAAEDGFVGRVGVAGGAFGPLPGVSAGVDGEESGIVFEIVPDHTLRMAGQTDGTFVTVACHARMDGVNRRLLVADQAGELGAIVGVEMAGDAIVPGSGVSTGIDWEVLRIVGEEFTSGAGRVTGEAGGALVGVIRYSAVNRVGFGFGVAGQATEDASVVGIGVAYRAGIPYAAVSAGIYGEKENIVFKEIAAGAGRVTGEAGSAFPGVSTDASAEEGGVGKEGRSRGTPYH